MISIGPEGKEENVVQRIVAAMHSRYLLQGSLARVQNDVQLISMSTGHDDGHFAASGKVEAARVLTGRTSLGINDELDIVVCSLQLNSSLER